MALTANRMIYKRPRADQKTDSLGVTDGAVLFMNAMLGIAAGLVRPLVAGDVFVGLSLTEHTGDTSLPKPENSIRVDVSGPQVEDIVDGVVAVTDQGASVYASDDGTLTLTDVANSLVGEVVEVLDAATGLSRVQHLSRTETQAAAAV